MKIKISIQGHLQLERRGIFKPAYCPYNTTFRCSDNCALFGEPWYNEVHRLMYLNICRKDFALKKEDFTDERGPHA